MQEPGDGEKFCKMLSSNHDIAIAVIISQQLRMPQLGLHQTKPLYIKKELRGQLSALLNYWNLVDSVGMVILFSMYTKISSPGFIVLFQMYGHTGCLIHLSGL